MTLLDVPPISTEIGIGRKGKLCQCVFCGYTAVCLPADDFYSYSAEFAEHLPVTVAPEAIGA